MKHRGECRLFVVTGTDTRVGKTVIAAALTRALCARGFRAVGLKPLCSGGRADARYLRTAADNALSLDEVNPWHFRAALTPALAARKEGKRVRLAEVVNYIRSIQRRFDMVVVESAGGLLSPLGEDFDSRDLILALRALPVIVAANKLGAVNQVRLVLEALPRAAKSRALVVLVEQPKPDIAGRSNPTLLRQFVASAQLRVFPRLGPGWAGEISAALRLRRVFRGFPW